jgi:hypothetical protein
VDKHRIHLPKYLPSLIAAVVTVLIVGVALTVAQDEDPSTGLSQAERDRIAVESVSPRLPALVGAFRRAQTPDDRIPADPAGAQSAPDALPGENPSLSRRLTLAEGGHALVWPFRNGVCYSWGGSAGCTATSLLEREGALIGTTGEGAGTQAFVLARDGVTEIYFELTDGRKLGRQTRDNVLLVSLPAEPKMARWERPDGTAASQRLP